DVCLPAGVRDELRWTRTGEQVEPVALFGDAGLNFWGPVAAVAVSSDGRYVAGAGGAGTVQVCPMPGASLVRTFEAPDTPAAIAFHPGEPVVAIADSGGSVALWNVETGAVLATIESAFGPLAYSPDGRHLAVRATRQEIALYDAGSAQLRRTLLGHSTGALL